MTRENLAELQRLAKPALRHAELVDLAKEKSPNKVYEIAVARWPKRQAKAARSLAQMRRDNPRAFEAFIASMEHARSAETDTEHARERKQVMTSQLMKSLEQLSDPRKKFEIMIRNGLLVEASDFFLSLESTMTPVLWRHWDGRKDSGDLCPVEIDEKDPLAGTTVAFFPADTDLAKDRLNVTHGGAAIYASLAGLIKNLKWTDEQATQFVRRVLERMVKTPIYTHYFVWVVYGMEHATRHFLKPEDKLAQEAERWMILRHFRHGELFNLRQRLPGYVYDPRHSVEKDWQVRAELNPIVDRMLEVGMTMEEIRKEFLKWIEEKGKIRSCRYQFMLAVTGAKCFEDDHKSLERVRELLRKHYLPSIKAENDLFFAARMYQAFGSRHIAAWRQGDEKFFRPRVVDALSHGSAGAVYQWLLTYGYATDFYSNEVRQAARGADSGKFDQAVAWEMMRVMAPDAVQLATKAERFGVAAALTQYFTDSATPSKVRELVQLAVDLDQPIALSWRNSIEKAKDNE